MGFTRLTPTAGHYPDLVDRYERSFTAHEIRTMILIPWEQAFATSGSDNAEVFGCSRQEAATHYHAALQALGRIEG